MRRPWWMWLRPIIHTLFPSWALCGFQWWRRLWGGHWERWYVDPCHAELWMLNEHGTRPGACFGTPRCEDYTMPLSPQQVRAVEALDWVFDLEHNRREGRSVAFAVALIRQALRHPGRPIAYTDHTVMTPEVSADRYEHVSRGLVARLIEVDARLRRLTWRIDAHNFRYQGEAIQGWWPDDTSLGGSDGPSTQATIPVRQFRRQPLPLQDAAATRMAAQIRAAEDEAVFAALNNIAVSGFEPPKPPEPPPPPPTSWERLTSDDD